MASSRSVPLRSALFHRAPFLRVPSRSAASSMSLSLPPLNTLRAFEAVARFRSATLAAQELCVTPSAVSHQVRKLERWLGAPLFQRRARALELTECGRLYLATVEAALREIERGTRALIRDFADPAAFEPGPTRSSLALRRARRLKRRRQQARAAVAGREA